MKTWCLWLGMLLLAAGCSGDKEGYTSCSEPADCSVPADAEAVCLDKGGDGFCSWLCSTDEDCQTDTGSGSDGYLCASFEDEAARYCLISCEEDADACPDGLTCRSSGGGSENRKVCAAETEEDTPPP